MGIASKVKYLVKQFPFIYPRGIIDSCADWIDEQGKKKGIYFSQRGPWVKTIFPEGFVQNIAPQTLGTPNDKAFYPNRNYPTPKASLFYLQNCYVLGHKGLIMSAGQKIFQEFSHHFGITTLKKFIRNNPFYTYSTGIKKIPGIGIVLISPESNNYYHWLSDVLPRIKLYESILDQADHICIASNVSDRFMDVLTEFGIPKEKILLINEKEKLHFDHLYVSSLPGSEGRSPEWAINYVREKLVRPTAQIPEKNIYFKRGDSAERKILNEKPLITILQSHGFEIIEPGELSIGEQADLMQRAKIVVAAHGAALSNLIFSREKTAVIELFSPDYFRTDCYYTLSSILKLNYWYISGEKPAGAGWGDIIVDEGLLTNNLIRVLATSVSAK